MQCNATANAALPPKLRSRFPPLEESKRGKVPPASCRTNLATGDPKTNTPGLHPGYWLPRTAASWSHDGTRSGKARLEVSILWRRHDISRQYAGCQQTRQHSKRALLAYVCKVFLHVPQARIFFFFPPFLGRLVQTLRNAFPAQRSGHTTARGNLPALPRSPASAHLSHQENRVPTSHLRPP